jgi:hypothetical protein
MKFVKLIIVICIVLLSGTKAYCVYTPHLVSAFPHNPAKGYFNPFSAMIDTSSEKSIKESDYYSLSIESDDYPTGIYFLTFKTNNNAITKKIIINH